MATNGAEEDDGMKLTRWERERIAKREGASLRQSTRVFEAWSLCNWPGCAAKQVSGMHCEEHERAFWAKAAASIGKQAGWSPEETKQRGEDAASFYVGRGAKR
jgi:hypothetical protein